LTISAESHASSTPRTPLAWVAAGFGSGWLPKAPGTWGSLFSLLPAWLLIEFFGVTALLVATVVVTWLGCAVCARLLPQMSGDHDPGWIVIDEWAGQWLAMVLLADWLPDGLWLALVAFVAFRLFDIVKPWPISAIERLGPDWWSIMADDLAAGLLGALLVMALLVGGGAFFGG